MNGDFYLVLRRLKRRVNRVRPAIAGNWKLHHDNAPNHTCSKVTDYLTQNGVAMIPQPPPVSTWPQQTFFYSQK